MKLPTHVLDTAKKLGLDYYQQLEVTASSKGVSLMPWQVASVNSLLADIITWQPAVVIDANANIGSDTINFARNLLATRIIAIEKDPATYRLLQANTKMYANVTAYEMSCVEYLRRLPAADIIYFDPPWPEYRDYKLQAKVSLELDKINILELIREFLPKARMVILKTPFNYADYDKLPGTVKKYDVVIDSKISFSLCVVTQ